MPEQMKQSVAMFERLIKEGAPDMPKDFDAELEECYEEYGRHIIELLPRILTQVVLGEDDRLSTSVIEIVAGTILFTEAAYRQGYQDGVAARLVQSALGESEDAPKD